MKTKKITKEIMKIEKVIEFQFTYFNNAQNLSQAIELGGYYAKISEREGNYIVEIYKRVR